MNTIMTIASTNASILAIELGKYKCVACIYDPVDAAARVRRGIRSVRECRAARRRALYSGPSLERSIRQLGTLFVHQHLP
jgi:hypothetical protein